MPSYDSIIKKDNDIFLGEISRKLALRVPSDKTDEQSVYNNYLSLMLALYAQVNENVLFQSEKHNIDALVKENLMMTNQNISEFIKLIANGFGLYISDQVINEKLIKNMISLRDFCQLIIDCRKNPGKYKSTKKYSSPEKKLNSDSSSHNLEDAAYQAYIKTNIKATENQQLKILALNQIRR